MISPRQRREDEARRLAASGMGRKDIARILGVHIKTVHRYLTDRNYAFIRPKEFKGNPETTEMQRKQLDLIRRTYRKGDTQTSLARKTGIHVQQVSNLFMKFNLNEEFGIDEAYVRRKLQEASRKGRESATARRKEKAEEHRREVLGLAGEGMSVNRIILKTGLSRTTVRNFLKAAGLMKRRHEAVEDNPGWLADAVRKERNRRTDIAKILKTMERDDVDSQKKISEITGLPQYRVSILVREENLWARAGRERPKHPTPVTSEAEAAKRKTRILGAFAPGRTEREIADISGYDRITVHRILGENGLRSAPEKYDFSDAAIRRTLLGKMFTSRNKEAVITHFIDTPKGWRAVIGGETMTAETFSQTYRLEER